MGEGEEGVKEDRGRWKRRCREDTARGEVWRRGESWREGVVDVSIGVSLAKATAGGAAATQGGSRSRT